MWNEFIHPFANFDGSTKGTNKDPCILYWYSEEAYYPKLLPLWATNRRPGDEMGWNIYIYNVNFLVHRKGKYIYWLNCYAYLCFHFDCNHGSFRNRAVSFQITLALLITQRVAHVVGCFILPHAPRMTEDCTFLCTQCKDQYVPTRISICLADIIIVNRRLNYAPTEPLRENEWQAVTLLIGFIQWNLSITTT